MQQGLYPTKVPAVQGLYNVPGRCKQKKSILAIPWSEGDVVTHEFLF